MIILHCSDIHLGRKPIGGVGDYSIKRFNDYFESFSNIIDFAVANKPEVIIITGDLFDKKELSPEILQRTENILTRLKEVSIPILVIEGNHDNITFGYEHESWLIYLLKKGLIQRPHYRFDSDNYIFEPIKIQDIDFYGLGYPGSMVDEVLTALNVHLEKTNEKKNVVLVHTAITGHDFFAGTCKKETIDTLKNNTLYIAGGHYHYFHTYPAREPKFFVPGSPEYWDRGEFKQTKGFIIFDTETKEYQFVHSLKRKVHQLKYSSTDSNIDKISQDLENLNIKSGEDIIDLNIILKRNEILDISNIEKILENKNPLKYFINIGYEGLANGDMLKSSNLTITEIESEIIKTWEHFSDNIDESSKYLSLLKSYQENSQESDFDLTIEQWLENTINKEVKIDN